MKTKRKVPRLYVEVSDVVSDEGVPLGPQSWAVLVDVPDDRCVLLWGFARKKDAEIAMLFLLSLTVNWTAPSRSMWRQLATAGYPDRPSLMQAACERLQW